MAFQTLRGASAAVAAVLLPESDISFLIGTPTMRDVAVFYGRTSTATRVALRLGFLGYGLKQT